MAMMKATGSRTKEGRLERLRAAAMAGPEPGRCGRCAASGCLAPVGAAGDGGLVVVMERSFGLGGLRSDGVVAGDEVEVVVLERGVAHLQAGDLAVRAGQAVDDVAHDGGGGGGALGPLGPSSVQLTVGSSLASRVRSSGVPRVTILLPRTTATSSTRWAAPSRSR